MSEGINHVGRNAFVDFLGDEINFEKFALLKLVLGYTFMIWYERNRCNAFIQVREAKDGGISSGMPISFQHAAIQNSYN